ncbi:MAG: hypothetical protein EPGJADBJ_04308 [Saprospiraceae bacterium]|nr:hypothetical protein [Saprospiraceae bacterium]
MLWILLSLQSLLNPSFISLSETAAARQNAGSVVTWLTEQDHDFGELRQGKPASFVFQFKNALSDTIVLQTVRTTCGCTAARYTEDPIPPGATGEITVEYDAYQSGSFNKKIRVFFDKQKKAEILWIRGVVE